jgi:metaxin
MPSQEAHDQALAVAQLVLARIYPAYLISYSTPPSTLGLLFANPPPLLAGLTTPLPASLTGDARDIDNDEVVRRGIEGLSAVSIIVGDAWALDAE